MDAARETIRDLAAQVMTGQVAPVEGARRIAAAADWLDEPGELTAFADLARTGNDDAILERVSLILADTA